MITIDRWTSAIKQVEGVPQKLCSSRVRVEILNAFVMGTGRTARKGLGIEVLYASGQPRTYWSIPSSSSFSAVGTPSASQPMSE